MSETCAVQPTFVSFSFVSHSSCPPYFTTSSYLRVELQKIPSYGTPSIPDTIFIFDVTSPLPASCFQLDASTATAGKTFIYMRVSIINIQ
jgi:hypothetical protein